MINELISYIVTSGDTLSSISNKYYGTPYKYEDIARVNNISNPNVIHVGEKIIISKEVNHGRYRRDIKSHYKAYKTKRTLVSQSSPPSSQKEESHLNQLIDRESGNNPLARNSKSGACGIGQANPCEKMKAYGSDYRTNRDTQLRWMKNYIRVKYGNASIALEHHKRFGWY